MAMKLVLKSILSICVFAFFSCAKEELNPDDPSGNGSGTVSTGEFKWTVENGATTTADSAVCYIQITTIYAYKSGTLTTLEINLSDMSSGSYPVSSSTGNEIKYVSGSSNLSAKSGTVNLTNNANGKVSGNLTCTFNNTAISGLSAQFSDVPIR